MPKSNNANERESFSADHTALKPAFTFFFFYCEQFLKDFQPNLKLEHVKFH